jgi:hypothetical protein
VERTPVSSSNLAAVGYDPKTETLEIEFLHGGVYQYLEVPEEVYTELMAASSHGSYFNSMIRGAFSYHQIKRKR